jgi:hypothetical protein
MLRREKEKGKREDGDVERCVDTMEEERVRNETTQNLCYT